LRPWPSRGARHPDRCSFSWPHLMCITPPPHTQIAELTKRAFGGQKRWLLMLWLLAARVGRIIGSRRAGFM
jgi:hypothetical protein